MTGAPDIIGFWTWFAAHQHEIHEIIAGKRSGRVTELLDNALAESRLEKLTYEVTGTGGIAELTFTPQGDKQLAKLIDTVVASAPSFEGWVIYGRVPRKSVKSALAFVRAIHGIDISDAQFKVVVREDRYHLCFLHDTLAALPEEKRFSVASTLLDHALGEQIVMGFVGSLDFRASGEGIAMSLLINEIIRETGGDSEAA